MFNNHLLLQKKKIWTSKSLYYENEGAFCENNNAEWSC